MSLLTVTLSAGRCTESPGRRNVLIVVMDTTRADRCSFGSAYDRETTPRLAAFAEDATVFTNAWSPARWTPPSHASLFTGLRPENHGCRPGRRTRMRDNVLTLADRLAAAGYATGAFVANPVLQVDPRLLSGFQRTRYMVGDYVGPHAEHAPAGTVLEELSGWAAGQRRSGRPFFAFANLLDVHSPFTPSRETEREFVTGSVSRGDIDAARDMGSPHAVRHNFGVETVPPERLALLSDLYDAELADWTRRSGRSWRRGRPRGYSTTRSS